MLSAKILPREEQTYQQRDKQAEHRTHIFRKQDLTATHRMRYDQTQCAALAFPRNGIVGENQCYETQNDLKDKNKVNRSEEVEKWILSIYTSQYPIASAQNREISDSRCPAVYPTRH